MPSWLSRLLATALIALLLPASALAASRAHAPGASQTATRTEGHARAGARKHHRRHHRRRHARRHRRHGRVHHGRVAHVAEGHHSAPGSNPSGPVPDHIPTWAYDDGCNGGTGASSALVRGWVTYAESNCGPNATKALSDCTAGGQSYCTPVQYLDANRIYQQGSVPVASAAQESWWLHQPGHTDPGHRLTINAYGGGNILNQSIPAVDSWFHDYVQKNYDAYPALMMDDTTGSLSDGLWGSGFMSSQEISSASQLEAAHDDMAAAMTHTDGTPFLQIDNGLSANDNLVTPFRLLKSQLGVHGVIVEGAPMEDGQLTSYYGSLLDEMAYIDHTTNDFVVLLSYDQNGSTQARLVQAATTLLGYSPGHTVSWSDLETNSDNLAVWPEEGIVPTQPIQTMGDPSGHLCLAGQGAMCSTGGHNGLQVQSGVYRREFGDCYDQGTSFGQCAAIVNTTGSAVTVKASWLTQSYGHEITLDGGDVQSGGTIETTGAPFNPGSTTIPAHGALLLSA